MRKGLRLIAGGLVGSDGAFAESLQVQVNFDASRSRDCRNQSITVKYYLMSVEHKSRLECIELMLRQFMNDPSGMCLQT